MKKTFVEKVVREGSVDTRSYRYVCKDYADRREIQRLPLDKLDTTAALTEWETVLVIK